MDAEPVRSIKGAESSRIMLARGPQCFPELCVALAASGHGVVITDARRPSHPVVYSNRAFELITGYSGAELAGRGCGLLHGAETDPADRATIRAALDARQSCELVIRNYRKDGTPFWNELTIRPVHDEAGSVSHFLGLLTDVSARVEAERERDRFFALSLDLLCIANVDGRFRRVNPAFSATLGYSAEELLARPFLDFVHPDDVEATQAALEQVRTVPLARFVNRYRHRDGSYRWLEWSSQPLQERGEIYAVARDVTAQRAEGALRQAHEGRLMQAQRLESLALLAGGIAHDFNNLLTVIQGNIDLALLDAPPSTPLRDFLEHALSGAAQARDLAGLLLTYAGRSRPQAQPLDLNALVRQLAAMLRGTIPPAVTLRQTLADRLPAGLLDAGQTRQVVMNLVINAVEALGAAPGVVALSTYACSLARTELDAMLGGDSCSPGSYLCLEVADSGGGMDSPTLNRIFEPFFTTKPAGRGLGLATVLGLVRAQGGALRVESALGAGTTFHVYFPLAPAG